MILVISILKTENFLRKSGTSILYLEQEKWMLSTVVLEVYQLANLALVKG